MNGENERGIRDVMVSLATHEGQISELDHRIKAQEQQIGAINGISLNVKELAVTMKGMLDAQKSQSERITKLEKAPLARYEKIAYSVISAILGFLSAYGLTLL